DGLAEVGDGLVRQALVIQREAQVVEGGGVARGGGDGRLEPAQPLVRPLAPVVRVVGAERHQQGQVPRPPAHRRQQQLPPPLHLGPFRSPQGGREPRGRPPPPPPPRPPPQFRRGIGQAPPGARGRGGGGRPRPPAGRPPGPPPPPEVAGPAPPRSARAPP